MAWSGFLGNRAKMQKIAIQGYAGCYHHIAANLYFGRDIEIVPCDTFRAVAAAVKQGEADMGLMAIQGTDSNPMINQILRALPESIGGVFSTLIGSFVMILWFSGVQILLFLSSIQKMDKAMYEAADIDGASAWETFWMITPFSFS